MRRNLTKCASAASDPGRLSHNLMFLSASSEACARTELKLLAARRLQRGLDRRAVHRELVQHRDREGVQAGKVVSHLVRQLREDPP